MKQCIFVMIFFVKKSDPQVLVGTNSIGSRFGFAILSGFDIDRNGYEDVIISAPLDRNSFDQDRSGSIYLYYGSSDGLSDSKTQVWCRLKVNNRIYCSEEWISIIM